LHEIGRATSTTAELPTVGRNGEITEKEEANRMPRNIRHHGVALVLHWLGMS